MGCSSSALHKAGDASRFRSVTSNEHFSTKEENESCFAQPKPCKMGSGPSFYDNVLRDSLPPLEKLKIPKASMANGVNLLCEQPLASWGKDVADQPGKTQLLEGPEGSESPQPGGRDDIPGREEKNKDAEAVTEIQYLKGNAETKSLTTEASDQPLRTAGERDPAGTVKGPENPRTAREMKPLETSEEKQLLETAGELQAQKTGGNDEQLHLPETVPKGSESPEILEESQFVDTAEEQQLQETGGGDEQPQLLETIPKENEMPEMLGRNQLVETAVKNDSLHKMPKGPGNMEQIQPEGIVESMKQQATEANVEMVRNIHTSEEDQQVEGETGEKVESEVVNEKVSEKAEKKEEETGEAVGPSAAT
ncbi:glutamate-rich protein 5 isoform X2 [Choloepus didactylus]|uniref:glutamate-rich protein 5 isoform X2 n=1 Tax=Choloepus didactylus TaxID=27675 RepID=UPI00189E7FCA|nr:glutamate-rich protein 5 isoform X2 [Choloepus didactylus]